MIFGGVRYDSGLNQFVPISDAWYSNNGGVTFTQAVNPPWSPRYGMSCGVVGSTVIMVGGSTGHTGLYENTLNEVWVTSNNGASWLQQPSQPSGLARVFAGPIIQSDSRLLIAGGRDNAGNVLSDTWTASLAATAWARHESSDYPFPARFGHSSAVVAYGQGKRILLIGGAVDHDAQEITNDVYKLLAVQTAEPSSTGVDGSSTAPAVTESSTAPADASSGTDGSVSSSATPVVDDSSSSSSASSGADSSSGPNGADSSSAPAGVDSSSVPPVVDDSSSSSSAAGHDDSSSAPAGQDSSSAPAGGDDSSSSSGPAGGDDSSSSSSATHVDDSSSGAFSSTASITAPDEEDSSSSSSAPAVDDSSSSSSSSSTAADNTNTASSSSGLIDPTASSSGSNFPVIVLPDQVMNSSAHVSFSFGVLAIAALVAIMASQL